MIAPTDGPSSPEPAFSPQAVKRPFTESSVRAKLGWLARNLTAHQESIFMIEQLQPTWIGSKLSRFAYTIVFNLLLGLAIGAMAKIGWNASDSVDPLCDPNVAGCVTPEWPVWLALTALWTLGLSLVDLMVPDRLRIRSRSDRFSFWLRRSVRVVVFYGIWAALWWLWARLVFADIPSYWLRHPLEIGPVLAILYEARISRDSAQGRIRAVEALGWSWSGLLRGALLGFVGGFLFWLAFRYFGAGAEMPETVARNKYLHLPMGTAIGAFLGAISRRMSRAKVEPNQGIRLSLSNGLWGALAAGMMLGVPFNLNIRLLFDHVDSQTLNAAGAWVIFVFATIGFLWFGGLDWARHFTLRLFLRGDIPLRLVPLLNYATELNFLQRVGGGYRFIHGYLQDYFASLPSTPEDPKAADTAGETSPKKP